MDTWLIDFRADLPKIDVPVLLLHGDADRILRSADAVHLASALALGDPELTIAVWDRRLHTGAPTAGLRVAPAYLPTT